MSLEVKPILDVEKEILILLDPNHSIQTFLDRCVDEVSLSDDLIDLSDEPSLQAVYQSVYSLLDDFSLEDDSTDDPFPVYVYIDVITLENIVVRNVYVQKSIL